jgi:hypothetical protein
MANKASIANIKRNLNFKMVKEIGVLVGSVLAVEAIPMAIQAIGGYKEDGTPNINASGPVVGLSSGALGAAVALAYDRKDIANAIVMTKAVKHAYIWLNPKIASVTGTPLLPEASNAVIQRGAIPSGVSDSVPVTMPDGSIRQIEVAQLNDRYAYRNDTVDQIVGRLGDYSDSAFGVSDYNDNALANLRVGVSDYTNNALALNDYTDNALQEDFSNTPLPSKIANASISATSNSLADITSSPTGFRMGTFDSFANNLSRLPGF